MTAPVLQLPVKVLRSATAGRRPGDGTFRALTDGEVFINTQDRVLCYLSASGTLLTVPFDPAYFAGLAPLASPVFTGTPTAPTQGTGDNSTNLATTAYADRAAGAGGVVKSVAGRTGVVTIAIGDVAGAAPLASPAFTGTPSTASTPAAGDNSTSLATTAYADRAVAAAQKLIGDQPVNLMLAASVASSALTVSVLGANGAAPSASNPVLIPFRDNNKATGDLAVVAITSPLAITVPNGATLGTKAGAPCRVWIVAIASASGNAPSLGVQVCTDGATAIYPLVEGAGQVATAIGTGSTGAGVLYAPAAVPNGSTRILGTVEFAGGQATAGTWATAPSAVLRHLSGSRRPGDALQTVSASTTTANNNNTNAYATNGAMQGVAATITPVSPINAIHVRTSGGTLVNLGTNNLALLRLTRGASGLTLAEEALYFYSNGGAWGANSSIQSPAALEALDFPGTTAATTYGTQLKNGDNTSNVIYPNSGKAVIVIEELVV